ncbi:hypothetical protein [Halorhabdus sp. BNX81]|uniref:Nmad3 family putative nucleotide modification protein n=1 Tax=Halorhabdus sp. BNX81 TaxID=2980181 RepID=UPI0023DD264C|nr:hypothetical protein [Halorhabdus sp. BNX81]WEL22531.1 Uncharacterized protein HBNXHr_2488 [Halorhabdus sp. BNX81]
MTVVLAGVGADQSNVGRNLPLYDDGTFEYIPIPEKTPETDESETFGTWPLRNGGVAADLLSKIRPAPGREEEWVTDPDRIADWPLHRDPNFDALTYGEHRGSADRRQGYVRLLEALDPGDVVGFYAGLAPPGGHPHRYLIGYFTVESVLTTAGRSPAEKRDLLADHPENAHTKRADEGTLYYDRVGAEDKYVAIVAGREPGGLFDRDPIRLSERYVKPGNERVGYYLREEIADEWHLRAPDADPVALTRKPAMCFDLSGGAFRDRVGIPGTR